MVLTRSASSRLLLLAVLLAACVSASGCEIVGGIFKAGLWAGVIMVVLVVAIVMFIINKARG
ncbi:MAG: hypothetical protein M3545_03275 [Acidobacteriota bacterium]|nr:hypothetical protein [Acidobacteriota bacterium]